MKILNTKNIRNQIIEDLKSHDFKNKLIILSKEPSKEAIYYRDVIIKRLKEFDIDFSYKEFKKESQEDILAFLNSFDKEDGFIILSPFGSGEDLEILRENIDLKDLDSFTYKSQGRAMDGDFYSLPATARSIAKFLESFDIKGKKIAISNSTRLIGRPLAMYLSERKATVTILNSKTKNPRQIISACDIFISAIGRANHYDKTYFKDGMLLIDVGTSYINGKIVGDINFNDIKDMDLFYLGVKSGIGSITTLTLVEGLKY